jgi:hypothetical protein
MTSPPFGFFLCHVEIMARGTHDNDNEPLSFVSLAALTANVTRYLRLGEQKDDGSDERDAGKERDKKALEQREFVRLRLFEIQRFEDRARGRK